MSCCLPYTLTHPPSLSFYLSLFRIQCVALYVSVKKSFVVGGADVGCCCCCLLFKSVATAINFFLFFFFVRLFFRLSVAIFSTVYVCAIINNCVRVCVCVCDFILASNIYCLEITTIAKQYKKIKKREWQEIYIAVVLYMASAAQKKVEQQQDVIELREILKISTINRWWYCRSAAMKNKMTEIL